MSILNMASDGERAIIRPRHASGPLDADATAPETPSAEAVEDFVDASDREAEKMRRELRA